MADVVDRLITKVEIQDEQGVVRGLSRVGGAMRTLSGLAAGAAAIGFLAGSAKAAMESEDALQRYANVARIAGNALPVEEAARFAAAQQEVTTNTDEAVLAVMS